MSHVDQGPLASYNSLADHHLAGYFTNTRMRRHLRKAGLVNKYGEIVTENTYRLNMSRREHKQHVKDMLAQAIVHKTLDLERARQAEIRRKLEEIAKIELVRRVRASRVRKRETDILPYLSPRSSSSRPSSGPEEPRQQQHRSSGSSWRHRNGGRARPTSNDPPRSHRKRRPISALSSNYEDDDEGAVVYLDDEGRPITPAHVDEAQLRYTSKDPIDTRHLYSLDTAALRKYATLMARMEQGRMGTSPYLTPQVPIPPKSPKSSRATSARRTPRSAQRYGRVESAKSLSPKRPATANQAYLHPPGSVQRYKGQQETFCQVNMVYHGSSLTLAREMLPGRSKQDIVVEQQHCGGNTLTVFKDALERGADFSFLSYRHRGYPFSLSIYIDGKMDCRVSTCCEYRHKKGGRIGGKKGHFSISGIEGVVPCYKCQVEKGVRIGNQAPRPKLKRPPEHQEEVVVVETAREDKPPTPEPEDEPAAKAKEIMVPVEDGDDQKTNDKYDEDFESSDSSSAEEAGGLESFQPKDARGVEKTTGKVDINELTSDDDSDQNKGRKVVSKPRQKSAGKGRSSRRKSSGSSRSSSSRSSSSDSDRSGRRNPQSKVAEKPKKQKNASPVVLKSTPDAAREDKAGNSRQDGSKGGNDNMDKEPIVQEAVVEETEVKNQMDAVTEDREKEEEAEREDNQHKKERRHSSSSSSSSSSKSSKGGGSTKDYSDSEGEEEKGKKEKKEEAIATPVVALDDDKEEAGEREEETVAVVGEGDGEAEEVRRDVPAAVVEVAVNREDDEEEKQQKKFDDAAKEPTIVATPSVELSTTAEAADHGGDKRRNSDASTSSVSTSSSSGSASIADKGPNTKNDPTAVASHAQEVEIQRNREEKEDARIAAQVNTPLMEVEVKSEDAPQKEDKTVKEAESEDSSSDSSNSDSDNEDEAQKKKDELALEKKRQEEEEENLRIKKLKEEQEREKLQELEREKERQKKLEEEERERQRQKEEEEKKQAESVPAVKVSQHSGSSSDSDSSDSDDDNRDKKTTSSKNGVIQTEADVHRRQSVQSNEADSDPEATHGGHDPDNVANGPEDAPPSPPRPPAATVPKAQTGSIQPLLEKSKSMVEIKGVTLNKSQLYECAAHVENNGRISQLNLVNCGLDDDDIQKVVEAVKASPSNPVLLNLSLNPITPRCADYLLDLLDAKSSIEALLLQGTRLGDEGATILADGLLSNHKRKKEQKGKGESLKELRELDLSDSKIGDDGIKAVARLVSSDMEVDTLTLSSNEAVSESGWTHLADAIARNHTLETLTLDHNLLGDSGVKIISDGLKYNTTVTALDLNGVGIGQEGGRALVELLKVNTTLLEITLVGNSRLDKSMLDDINKYIALNKTMGSSQSQS